MTEQELQKLSNLGQQLLRCGFRGLVVLSGDRLFHHQAIADWRRLFPGDWLWVGDAESGQDMPQLRATAAREILGQQHHAAVFDAYEGLNAEALAAVSGTLSAGGWLLLLLPAKTQWLTRLDRDSLRWADSTTPIATPNFMHYLSQCLECSPVTEWQQHAAPRFADLSTYPSWPGGTQTEQEHLLAHLVNAEPAINVVIAARGRGKSALGGRLAQQNGHCLVTAPARRATKILAEYAQPYFHYMAPDALIAKQQPPAFEWLIIDEAAAIPTPLLHQLVKLYPRTLLTTTIQGYEGTGGGFILRFCQRIHPINLFQLHEPLRWARGCPLESWINKLFLFSDLESAIYHKIEHVEPVIITALSANDWQQMTDRACQFYQLLVTAHYRTTPMDLRRMMDGKGMQFWLSAQGEKVISAAWMVQEGGLEPALTQAIWAGLRRPRGNLVAQSLAAHSAFPQAAQMRSLRISRLAVHEPYRRTGVGTSLVRQIIASTTGQDYISVSFGFTSELSAFWQHCGFTLIRLGTQLEASSGCYAAMALYPLSAAGKHLTAAASRRWQRDWRWLQPVWFSSMPAQLFAQNYSQNVDDGDWLEVIGFAFAYRALPASLPALSRVWQHYAEQGYPNIAALLSQDPLGMSRVKKQRLEQLRDEIRRWISQFSRHNPEIARRVAETRALIEPAPSE